MLQKKNNRIFRYIFFYKIIAKPSIVTLNHSPLFFVNYLWRRGNAFLYKKLSFISLALNIILFNKFYSTKMKSLMYAAWRSVSAYTSIF